MRITYEGLTADDGGTLQRVADAMGIKIDPQTRLEDGGHSKVSPANTDELRTRFLADFERSLG